MDDNTKQSSALSDQTSAVEEADAANSDLMKTQAAEATEETNVTEADTKEAANPFAALKESDSETEAAVESQETEAEIEEPETIEAIGTEEKTVVEDAESASSEPVTVEESASTETEEPTTEQPESENREPKTENEEPEKPAVPANPNARWYVVHTFAGHENKVATALRQRIEAERLENLIYDILVPTQDKIEIKGGKKETVKEKIFPGYILIKMELSDLSWLAVRTTQGVTSFIGAGNKPTPISEAEVATIVKFTTQGASPTFKDVFMVDDTVKIVDGPFAEFIGKVDSVDKEKGRVRVLVSIFGRETPVELDFLQVQKL